MATRAPAIGVRLHVHPTARVETAAPIVGRYLSIMSYRRDGTGVVTPVWFVAEKDRLLVMTAANSFKVARIRRNHVVTIAPCSARGRLKGVPVTAHAELLPPSQVERVKRLMARKYRFDVLFIRPFRALQMLFHPERREEESVIVAITPT